MCLEDDEMTERKYRYHTVNLKPGLANKIQEVIDSDKHGYASIPEFVTVAIRRYLRELEYIK